MGPEKSMGMDLLIRRLERDELAFPVIMAAAEGWNPGLADADPFWAADPQGWWGGVVGGELVSCISTVAYDTDTGPGFGFVGFYIVRPDLRGRGLGRRTWDAAMPHLEGRLVGLDGVMEQVPTYERSGFAPAYVSRRNRCTGGGAAPPGLTPLADVPFGDVSALDASCFPARREAFLQAWLAMPGATGLARVADGELRGFGVLRPCRQGCKIGPLLALEAATAELLLDGLLAAAPQGEPVFLDTPGRNPAALALADERGMDTVFETMRMYRGPEPSLPLERLYGVCTFELG